MNKFTANDLLEESIKELSNLKPGQEFILKDLFKGYIWNNQELGIRRTLGSLFLNYAHSNDEVEVLGKNTSNQQKYRKI